MSRIRSSRIAPRRVVDRDPVHVQILTIPEMQRPEGRVGKGEISQLCALHALEEQEVAPRPDHLGGLLRWLPLQLQLTQVCVLVPEALAGGIDDTTAIESDILYVRGADEWREPPVLAPVAVV